MRQSQNLIASLLLLAAFAGLVAGTATALSIHVPGDYASIGLALQHAFSGDSVIVACGTYDESGLVIRAGVTLRSETGQFECVVIEGDYDRSSILTCSESGELVRVEGLTFAHGGWLVSDYYGYGGGIHAQGCQMAISRCRFDTNFAGRRGGGLYADESEVTISECEFFSNAGAGFGEDHGDGGGIYASQSTLHIDATEFIENDADRGSAGSGGAIYCRESQFVIEASIFTENWGVSSGGVAAIRQDSTVEFEDSEFHGNIAMVGDVLLITEGSSATTRFCLFTENWGHFFVGSGYLLIANSTIVLDPEIFWHPVIDLSSVSTVDVSNSLFVLVPGGVASECFATPTFTCTNIFSPDGNAWVDCYADQLGVNGNISVDPQFCGVPGGGNYYLQSDSPCAPGNHPDGADCGLIGALPVGCDAVSTRSTSMSVVKSLY